MVLNFLKEYSVMARLAEASFVIFFPTSCKPPSGIIFSLGLIKNKLEERKQLMIFWMDLTF